MMRQMREATKPIMLFTALAFVALMVFQWGMDITGRSGGGVGEIGEVNGDPVMYDAYMAAYRQLYDQVQSSQQELIGSQQNSELEDQAFDQVVTQILVQQELRARGITVTAQEISNAAQYSPPEYIVTEFMDEGGGLDLQAYQSFLSTLPPEQLLILEAYYRDVIPRTKLLRQVGSGIYFSDAQLWQAYRDRNETASIGYVPFDPAQRYQDADFQIPQEDIAAYYRTHQEEFEIPARATVRYVVLDKTPTPADTVAVREQADSLRRALAEGADFAEAARALSSDGATASAGGALGIVRPGQMVPVFDSAIFAAPVGEIAGPVQSPFGFHVIEVTERWGQDSVQARHILLPIQRSEDSEIELLTLADSLEDMSEAVSLQEAASALGRTAQTAQLTLDFPFLSGAGQVSEGADWAFEEAAPGDVSPVFETQNAFYGLELVSSEPAGVLPLETASAAIRSTLLFDRKMERAQAEAQQLVDRVRGGESLVSVASDMGLELRAAGPFAREDFVPGVGRQNAVIGAAFGLPVGATSGVLSTLNNHFVIEVIERTPADSAAWRAQLADQRVQAVGSAQQQRLEEWIAALRASADIVDRRDEVFAPVEDPDALGLPMVF